jgi:ATP-dependent RNA helicase DDX24/MAK5
LIATDVAARGLDIPLVEHVVHFNLPRTADAYIHRSGRTARAQKPGFALLLCSAEEKGTQRALMKSLGRSTSIDRDQYRNQADGVATDMPELPIESGFLPKLKQRLALAKEIEKAQHVVKKENHDKNWLKEAAEAMDVDIDPSMYVMPG